MMAYRFEATGGREDALQGYLGREALPVVIDRPGMLGVHFGVADSSGSDIITEEKRARGGSTLVPGWVLLLEGISAIAVDAAAEPLLAPDALCAHGAETPIERGIYRLESSCEIGGIGPRAR
jgi:hypothetical protein